MENNIKSVILGHAVGDALGVPVEFLSRPELDRNPVTGMRGYGTYTLPTGCWSDDTSMTLAALDSLASGKVDYDVKTNRSCNDRKLILHERFYILNLP